MAIECPYHSYGYLHQYHLFFLIGCSGCNCLSSYLSTISRGIIHRTPSANLCKPQCTQNVFCRPDLAAANPLVPGTHPQQEDAGWWAPQKFIVRRLTSWGGGSSVIFLRRLGIKSNSTSPSSELDKPTQTIRSVYNIHTTGYNI